MFGANWIQAREQVALKHPCGARSERPQ